MLWTIFWVVTSISLVVLIINGFAEEGAGFTASAWFCITNGNRCYVVERAPRLSNSGSALSISCVKDR